MENNDRRQRQSTSGYAGQQGLIQSQSQYPVVSASDRYRPPLTAQTPTSAPSSGSRANPQSYAYAYGEGSQLLGSAIPPTGVAYTPDYASEQQRTSQSYSQYGQNVMYNVSSQQAAAPQSPYESVQPYQRQNASHNTAAIEVLSNQFGVPQSYYVAGESAGPTSAPATAMSAQNVPTQYSSLGYQSGQSPVGRETLAPSYTAGMSDPSQTASQGGFPQPSYAQQGSSANEEAYATYQAQLKRVNEYVRDSRIKEAGELVHSMSEWLLANAAAYGLVRDEEAMYNERLQLWKDFNTAWLTALQRQKELTQEMIDSSQRPQPPRSLIDYDYLERMGDQLVKACDQMEKHGLVDYEMGVWEEEIISMLTTCLELLEEVGLGPSSTQRPPPATSSRRR